MYLVCNVSSYHLHWCGLLLYTNRWLYWSKRKITSLISLRPVANNCCESKKIKQWFSFVFQLQLVYTYSVDYTYKASCDFENFKASGKYWVINYLLLYQRWRVVLPLRKTIVNLLVLQYKIISDKCYLVKFTSKSKLHKVIRHSTCCCGNFIKFRTSIWRKIWSQ